ncbi:restriction endonuclease subunit S [Cryomorpha ignava]|uniref:Restriction endonuclease subunit S n=1 Tax=Cryomorpha ignava TaxID=101383 RepID=A0A7K3WUC1_9FLAO|nr:restriction endonuclease subunit S [Cryomorpha ignava]
MEEIVKKPIVYGIVQAGVEVSDGVPYIKSTDVGGDINIDKLSRTSLEIAKKYKRSEVFPGDIVFSLRGNIGELSIVPYALSKANLTQGTARISVENTKADSRFVSYALKSSQVYKSIIKASKGSTFSEISLGELRRIQTALPSLSEQESIAKALSLMDEAINTNNHLIAQKELRKKWLMQNLLTGKKRLKGFCGEWREYSLGEMFSERNERETEGLTLLSIGQNGVYPQNQSVKKDTSNADKSKYKKICVGDIGYNTMRMWQGRSALSGLEGIVSPSYTIVRAKKGADALYFSYFFKTPKMVNLFWRNSQGLVGDTLNCKFKDFSIVKAILPQKEEQVAIARLLQKVDEEMNILRSKTEKLSDQKKWMMQVLLTGKKRLKIN